MEIAYGWKKDRFNPEAILHKPKMGLAKLPSSVDLSSCSPPVRQQGSQQSCVGFSIAGIVTATLLQCIAQKPPEWFSPQWVLNGARYIEGTLAQNAGVAPDDAFDWLTLKGNLLEHSWPYNAYTLDQSAPSSQRESEAILYPNWKVVRVTNGTEGIISALADYHFVSLGVPWFKKWEAIGPSGRLPEITANDQIAGGHQTFLYGYDSDSNVFLGENSWGCEWGKQGLYAMPFSAIDLFKRLGGYDAFYVVFRPKPKACTLGRLLMTMRH